MTAPETREALVDRLAHYERLVEVGIGHRTDVVQALARREDVTVTATDIRACSVPDGTEFVRDDITDPCSSLYSEADAIYALNCPPDLQRAVWDVARCSGADCLFTTLGSDPTLVRADPETLPGETLFRVCSSPTGEAR